VAKVIGVRGHLRLFEEKAFNRKARKKIREERKENRNESEEG
jgi:hypothetical protein